MKLIKRLIICFTLIVPNFVVSGQTNNNPIDTATQAIIKFDHKILDLGKVKINSKTKAKFIFTNVGDKALFIKSIKPHCGCTTANYSKQPIKKGGSGEITIVYIAPSIQTVVSKTIVVVANTYEKSYLLKIKADIVK